MLNSGFDYLERADQRLLSDLGISGIVAGLDVNLSDQGSSVCIGPGIAYDRLGRRIKVDAPTILDLPDTAGSLAVLLKFAQREADPILDSFGRTVAQRLFESFSFVVRPIGADDAGKPKVM